MSKRADRYIAMLDKSDEVYQKDYSTGEYCHEQSFKWGFQEGYEQTEKDLGWHSVDESLPPIDEEVIVLTDDLNTAPIYKIAFGHIVDRMHCSDYNGWNVPGVKCWMPMPKLPEEEN